MQKNQRKILRKQIIHQRQLLTAAQQQCASKLINKQIARTFIFLRSNRIAFYLSNKGEVDTLSLLERALSLGKTCFLPILHPVKHNLMWFGRFELGDPLYKNAYGIYEPDLKLVEKIPPWSLDLVITPVVAFDSRGNRLGMGGGYYDRTFAFLHKTNSYKPILLGPAYSFQQLPEVPTADWDVPLDVVVTENNCYHFSVYGNSK